MQRGILPVPNPCLFRVQSVAKNPAESIKTSNPLHGVYDTAVVCAAIAHEGEEVSKIDIHATQEWAVAGTAIHEIGWHFAAQFQPGF